MNYAISCKQMHECDHKGLYLGLPYCNFKSKVPAFQQIEEKMAKREYIVYGGEGSPHSVGCSGNS